MTYRTHLKSAAITAILAGGAALPVQADIVHPDDVIVQGSICAGFDCINNESFGFDTVRVKENNTRIQFNDTSTGSFPTNNWQIRANSSSSGGPNFLGVIDQGATGESETGTIVFSVAAGARANALIVDGSGRVGLGTGSPVLDLHLVRGNTPSIRLDQDGTSGFTPQVWDLAGNETNFFIRDVTNGSRLPLRIFPNAPSNSLTIEGTTGDIGLGTSSPTAPLHLLETANTAAADPHMLVENNNATAGVRRMFEAKNKGGAFMAISNTNSDVRWNMVSENSATNSRFFINDGSAGAGTYVADAANEFVLDKDGNVIITGTITTTGGTCGGGCDLVFGGDYDLPSIEDHARLMWASGYLPNVGPTLENGPINVSDKVGRLLNELEYAHIYIEQLNQRIKVLEDAQGGEKG
jgi:hypothetical protein